MGSDRFNIVLWSDLFAFPFETSQEKSPRIKIHPTQCKLFSFQRLCKDLDEALKPVLCDVPIPKTRVSVAQWELWEETSNGGRKHLRLFQAQKLMVVQFQCRKLWKFWLAYEAGRPSCGNWGWETAIFGASDFQTQTHVIGLAKRLMGITQTSSLHHF